MSTYGPGKLKIRSARGHPSVWIAHYTDAGGKRRRINFGADKAVARRRLNKVIRDRDLELAGLQSEKGLDESARAHLEVYLCEHALRSSAKSARDVRSDIERVLRGIGANTLRSVTLDAVLRWRSLRIARGTSHRTANRELSNLKAGLSDLVRRGVLGANPLEGLQALPVHGRHRRKPVRALTEDEITALLRAARAVDDERGGNPQWVNLLALVATGCRWNELRQLRAQDVDIEGGTLYVRAETAKTGRGRAIPLDPALVAELDLKPGWAFRSRTGRQLPRDTVTMLQFLDEALRRAKIEKVDGTGRVIHLHALRHTFATRCARAGVPLRLTQAMTGHRKLETLVQVYQHVGEADVRACLDMLPSLERHEDGEPDRGACAT